MTSAGSSLSRGWIAFALLLIVFHDSLARAGTPVFVWIEAENPTSANFPFQAQAAGPPGVLSGGAWLARSIDKEEVARSVPPEGLLLGYDLKVPEEGEYQVWARVGFERVRAPFEWRIGEGAWVRAGAEVHTTNLVRLGLFMEAAWQHLGSVPLKAGPAHLQVRFREPGSDGRLLFGLDCFALVKGPFVPEGRLKPGEAYDSTADRAAAAHVFSFPTSPPTGPGSRIEIPLDGPWQAARYDDPDMDAQPYEPVKELPKPDEYPLRWMAVRVPAPAWERPELAVGHRILYRARVAVPPLGGRSYLLHFSGTNWIASIFVNGQLIGSHRSVLVPWDLDITRGIRPGETNELIVAIKGPYYAFDAKAANSTLENARNLPDTETTLRYARWVAPIYPSTKGEGDGTATGLVNPVRLIVAGPCYVSDAFVRPSVAKRRLDAGITLANPGARPRTLTVRCEAVRGGRVEHTFPPVTLAVDAGGQKTVSVGGEWTNPRLWWPVDHPSLYTLRTTVSEKGKPIDLHQQVFGFREVTIEGKQIRLNGVTRHFWNWVEVSGDPATPEAFLKTYRAEGNRFYRFSADSMLRRFFPDREARLDFYDRSGIPGRLSTCIDGMFINYDLRNPLVWENFDEHIRQVTRAYRNHPSILVDSLENELLYINAQNVYGGMMDAIEQKEFELVQAAKAMDPTRPCMVDGGGALKGDRLEINCPHYPEAPGDYYPDNAYTYSKLDDHSRRWPWDRKRPLMVGEMFFYAGKLADQAWIGGDRVFRSRADANQAAGKNARLLIEGYRWQGVSGIFPWVSLRRVPGARPSFSDLAVFTRKRALRLYSGRPGSILVKLFNDTLSSAPVTFQWAVQLAGKRVAGKVERLNLAPGSAQEEILHFTVPASRRRQDGQLLLSLSQAGKPGFKESEPLSALPSVDRIAAGSSESPVLLFDRSGRLAPFLQARKVSLAVLSDLSPLKTKTGLLLIGPDTLTPEEAFGTDLRAFAARGGRVLVLEQRMPLAGAALPAPVRPTPHFGGYAFGQAFGTPVFADLQPGDFEDWAGAPPTYQHAYEKPAGGGRSLVECGDGLNDSALIELPCGSGVIVACQLRVGAKLGLEPAAEHLLKNLMEYYGGYTPPTGTVAVFAPPHSLIGQALAGTGVREESVASLEQALAPGQFRVAVVPASAVNLQSLEQDASRLARFTAAGGWLMLWGLQPDGLAAFNRLVGWHHPIRPFRIERVTLDAPEHPLAATLGNRDLTFYGTREIAFGDYWLSGDEFSGVVGAADAAPFCQMPDGPEDPFEYHPTYDDHDPYNFVNGLLNSDSWRCIRQIWVDPGGAKPLVFGFREPATIRQINIWNNTNYWTIKDLDILFDDDAAHPLHVVLPPTGDMTSIPLQPARRVTKSITLQIRSWRGGPIIRDGHELRLVGIDNLQFIRQLPPEYAAKVQPLDNIGGLVAYPRGKGGIFLNQIKLMAQEPNPENAAKKIRLVATLLQNMGAGTRGSAVISSAGK